MVNSFITSGNFKEILKARVENNNPIDYHIKKKKKYCIKLQSDSVVDSGGVEAPRSPHPHPPITSSSTQYFLFDFHLLVKQISLKIIDTKQKFMIPRNSTELILFGFFK